MLDATATVLALRNRALSLSVCTTGSTTLSATTTGYARTTGSFLTDGFAVGMEVTPTGFVANTIDTIIGVSTLTLTTKAARTAESAASGRSIAVGLPALRAWENTDFSPVTGRHFVEEDYVPAAPFVVSFPPQGATRDERGLYVLRWYGLSNTSVAGLRKSVDALLALFTPGTTLTAGSNTVRIRGMTNDPGPYAGQLLPQAGGWSVITLTIPWRSFTTNAIAA